MVQTLNKNQLCSLLIKSMSEPINQSQKFSAKYEQLFLQSIFISFLIKSNETYANIFSWKQSILDSFTWRKVFSKVDARNNTIFWGRSWNKYSKILSRKQIILYLRKNNIIFMQSNIEGEGWRPKLRHPFVSIFARCTHVWISAEISNFNNFILSCNILVC